MHSTLFSNLILGECPPLASQFGRDAQHALLQPHTGRMPPAHSPMSPWGAARSSPRQPEYLGFTGSLISIIWAPHLYSGAGADPNPEAYGGGSEIDLAGTNQEIRDLILTESKKRKDNGRREREDPKKIKLQTSKEEANLDLAAKNNEI